MQAYLLSPEHEHCRDGTEFWSRWASISLGYLAVPCDLLTSYHPATGFSSCQPHPARISIATNASQGDCTAVISTQQSWTCMRRISTIQLGCSLRTIPDPWRVAPSANDGGQQTRVGAWRGATPRRRILWRRGNCTRLARRVRLTASWDFLGPD
ncbi:hypothetical protein BO99DRAFT_180714 [Aspergillus violaceofuscus CBS 115571]|uniref:Uncharacterized protein n=1 Tax=Aspergillus violaceofuscus (strain CBS 115571) TaxID=1450538 RepID=A0A2V5HPH9_ASPV1|nr:hypothetical protein BO99DRAFT_180714 [Aspergillus violaceofuscus CBS 115571]